MTTAFTASEQRMARTGRFTESMLDRMATELRAQIEMGWHGDHGRTAAAMMLVGVQADDALVEAITAEMQRNPVEAR